MTGASHSVVAHCKARAAAADSPDSALGCTTESQSPVVAAAAGAAGLGDCKVPPANIPPRIHFLGTALKAAAVAADNRVHSSDNPGGIVAVVVAVEAAAEAVHDTAAADSDSSAVVVAMVVHGTADDSGAAGTAHRRHHHHSIRSGCAKVVG